MSFATGLLALVLVSGDVPEKAATIATAPGSLDPFWHLRQPNHLQPFHSPQPGVAPGPNSGAEVKLRFQVRLLDIQGIAWRGTIHDRLTPAARQGNCTVWTANRDLIETLQQFAENATDLPAVEEEPDGVVHVRYEVARHMVADMRRVADAPPGKNTSLAFVPDVDQVRDDFDVEMTCRRVDQGVMAKASIRETHLAAMHTYSINDGVTNPKTRTVSGVTAGVQVAEVVSGKVGGEWLIPTDGILLVSFGAHTGSDKKGNAVVRERIAIVEPTSSRNDPLVRAANFAAIREPSRAVSWTKPSTSRPAIVPPVPIGLSPLNGSSPRFDASVPSCKVDVSILANDAEAPRNSKASGIRGTLQLPITPLSMLQFALSFDRQVSSTKTMMPAPTPPSRDLPTAVAADGTVVDLPPLPDEAVEPASSDEEAEPRPAPQARPSAPQPPTDRPLARVKTNVDGAKLGEITGKTIVITGHMIGRPDDRPVFVGPGDPARGLDMNLGRTVFGSMPSPTIRIVPSNRVPLAAPLAHTAVGNASDKSVQGFCCTGLEEMAVEPPPRPSTAPPLRADVASRVTQFTARGNTAITRDPVSGICRLICDDLVRTTEPKPTSLASSPAKAMAATSDAKSDGDMLRSMYSHLFRGAGQEFRCEHSPEAMGVDAECVFDDDSLELCGDEGGRTLNVQLRAEKGHLDVPIRVRSADAGPVTVRMPMADGSVIEVQARVVKKAGGK